MDDDIKGGLSLIPFLVNDNNTRLILICEVREEEEVCVCVTVNNESSGAATPLGHHITSHTGVVSCV